jgi:hypothetical protein
VIVPTPHQKLLLDSQTRLLNHGPLQPQCYTQCTSFSGCERLRPAGASDSSALSSGHLAIFTDITCQSFFQNFLDRSNLKRMDRAAFRAVSRRSWNLINEAETIDKCVELLTSVIQLAPTAIAPTCQHCDCCRTPLILRTKYA